MEISHSDLYPYCSLGMQIILWYNAEGFSCVPYWRNIVLLRISLNYKWMNIILNCIMRNAIGFNRNWIAHPKDSRFVIRRTINLDRSRYNLRCSQPSSESWSSTKATDDGSFSRVRKADERPNHTRENNNKRSARGVVGRPSRETRGR